MGDTARLNLDPDYFPLLEGLLLRYEHTSSEFEGVETVEIRLADVRAFKDEASARAVVTRTRMGRPASEAYAIRRTSRQVVSDGGVLGFPRLEFPRPPLPGKRWEEPPNSSEVASLEETLEVPAGKFRRCLRVNTSLAGGDGGSAIRYYAPGVGYVYEDYAEESWGARVKLLSFRLPPLLRRSLPLAALCLGLLRDPARAASTAASPGYEAAASTGAPVATPEVRVEEVAFAAAVSSMMPVGRADSFEPSAGKVYFWNRLRVPKLPARVKHVWRHDGRLVEEFGFDLRYSRTRVWSAKRVRPGFWQVDVADEKGSVIATATFPVRPAAPQ